MNLYYHVILMEAFLKPDKILNELKYFKYPTYKETLDFLKQTKGIYTIELLNWLNLPIHTDRPDIKYVGNLTIVQQWYIICELNDDSKLIEMKM